jgi:2,4-dienoyl-CoA reductase-like NADH-dependent reductase (Old Yellow Enzyme family)
MSERAAASGSDPLPRAAGAAEHPLLAPLRFPCGAVSRNRLALAPLTNSQSHDDGALSDDELRWLVRRAAGGFGIVETCAAFVSADGKGFEGQLGLADDRQLPRLAALSRAVAEHGALSIAQLYHGGVRASSRFTGVAPWSASRFQESSPDFETPREGSQNDIESAIEHFVAAAHRAHRAGFSGVELHAAHGYLLSQFLSRTMNLRSDAWGGSLENRARLLRTITRRVRSELSSPFVVGVRLSAEDRGHAVGLDADESATVARWLADDGVDYIHLSLWDTRQNLQKRPDEHPLSLFRRAVGDEIPLLAAGAIWTEADAIATLQRGADAVALGKAAILNPDWPRRFTDPSFEPERGPLSATELEALDVGPRFVDYLRRRFGGMVRE